MTATKGRAARVAVVVRLAVVRLAVVPLTVVRLAVVPLTIVRLVVVPLTIVRLAIILGTLGALASCSKETPQALYETVPVERRDIVLSATASGSIEPVLTVEVKSKASGEIIEMHVETGDDVAARRLLARIDPRTPRNALSQAEANLGVARAQLANAQSEMSRADTLFKRQVITQVEYENARLADATARAAVVRAETELESAQDQMDDTEIRAPVSGTIMAKNVELGTVISSPTRDVGGGTVLLTMADLDTVQVRSLVDETDIGKLQPGMPATLSVDAYPDRRFEGSVLKIEPLATVQQNVTMFPVLVRLANPGHLLKPGMTTEVEIHVGRRENVLAIPYAALRTPRDVASAASVLGLDPKAVQAELTGGPAAPSDSARSSGPETSVAGGSRATGATGEVGPAGSDVAGPAAASGGAGTSGSAGASGGAGTSGSAGASDGAGTSGSAGASDGAGTSGSAGAGPAGAMGPAGASKAGAAATPRGSRGPRGQGQGQGQGQGGSGRGEWRRGSSGGAGGAGSSASYIVFVLREGKPVPLRIRTGLTDLDHVEVLDGLQEGDSVLVLPSASLVSSQREMQERFQRMTGGGLPGVQQQQPQGGQRSGNSR